MTGPIWICIGLLVLTPAKGYAASLSPMELEIWNSPQFQKQFTESYIAVTDVEPRVTMDEREKMQKILKFISDDQMEEAKRYIEKYRNEAASAVFDFTLANIYFQDEQLDKAAEIYQVAVEKYPKFLRAWRNLSIIYIRKSEFAKALPALTKVIELGGGDALIYGLLGFAYSTPDIGNYLSAESAYRMAILMDAETLDWKMGLARSLFKQERYAEAASLCSTLIDENPDKAELWLLQANAFIGLNKPLKAAENYEFVDRLGASTEESLNMLGDIYINEELFAMAVDSYIRALEEFPDVKVKRAIRAAKVLAGRGAFEETQRLITRIEDLREQELDVETRKDILKLRARLAVAKGQGDEEVSVLEEIVELDPLDGEALILLGQHARRSGDLEKAVFYFERAASIEDYEADAKVRHAQLLVSQGKYSDALPLLKRAQMLKPREDVQKYLEQVQQVAKNR